MKYLLALIIFFAFAFSSAKAQIQVTNIYLGPQYGISFYENDKNKSEFGAFGGVEFNDRYIIGYEYYDSEIQKYEYKDFDDLYLSYHGPFVRYNLMTEKFRPYVSALFAWGDASPQPSISKADPFIFQPSIGAEIDLHKRVSAGLNVAYRKASSGDLITHPSAQTFHMGDFSAFLVKARVGINLFKRNYE